MSVSALLLSLLDAVIPVAQAQATAPDAAAQMPAWLKFFNSGGIFLVLLPLFYFMLIRPQMKRGREARDMLAKLAKGDEVIINGGLAGRLTSIGENYATVEIADKVEVKVQKSAIGTVLPKGTLKNL